MKKSQGNKGDTVFQRQKERKNIGNHEGSDITGKKPRRNRMTMHKKVGNSPHLQP
jgi:hypothetical protein